jgi:hypothetical protein
MTSRNDTKALPSRSLAGVAPLAPSVSSASSTASRLLVPLLLAEAAAFAGLVVSGKIPESLITAIRALLTF